MVDEICISYEPVRRGDSATGVPSCTREARARCVSGLFSASTMKQEEYAERIVHLVWHCSLSAVGPRLSRSAHVVAQGTPNENSLKFVVEGGRVLPEGVDVGMVRNRKPLYHSLRRLALGPAPCPSCW